MSLPLSEFEKYLAESVQPKAAAYFQEGAVSTLLKDGNKWQSIVRGTEDYEVIVYTKDGNLSGWDCSCPYSYSPICKHVGAVFHAIRERGL